MALSTIHFKQKLEEEEQAIVAQLQQVGRINPDNTRDWEAVAAPLNVSQSEDEDRAGEITSFEDRNAIEFELEKQLEKVTAALAAIEAGSYGRCTVCGNEIEEARLAINPTATTCKSHLG